jgi:hypothetical protein
VKHPASLPLLFTQTAPAQQQSGYSLAVARNSTTSPDILNLKSLSQQMNIPKATPYGVAFLLL